ncbi:MAG: RidA family protein [Pseudomonas sp.]|nr:RidA family protein [Pseudomonas sp.]
MSIQRQHTNERMSQIVVHQNTVYLAGQVAADEDLDQDAGEQTRSTLAEIEKLLAQAGSDKTQILSVTIYLKDIDADFAAMNQVWDQWLPMGTAPARATVEAKLCEPEILVEMSVIAAIPQGAGV